MGRTVLLVGSDPAGLKLLKLILREEGWAVVTALGGADAESALDAFTPGVMITSLDVTREERYLSRARESAIPTMVLAGPIDVSRFAEQVASMWRRAR